VQSDTVEQRIKDLTVADVQNLRNEATDVALDLGAELSQRRACVLRQYQQFADDYRHQVMLDLPEQQSFLEGFLLGTGCLCDGFLAYESPKLEKRQFMVKKTQLDILQLLFHGQNRMTPAQIAGRIGVHPSAVSRALKEIRIEGYVAFENPQVPVEDRRKKLYYLTDEGNSYAENLEPVVQFERGAIPEQPRPTLDAVADRRAGMLWEPEPSEINPMVTSSVVTSMTADLSMTFTATGAISLGVRSPLEPTKEPVPRQDPGSDSSRKPGDSSERPAAASSTTDATRLYDRLDEKRRKSAAAASRREPVGAF